MIDNNILSVSFLNIKNFELSNNYSLTFLYFKYDSPTTQSTYNQYEILSPFSSYKAPDVDGFLSVIEFRLDYIGKMLPKNQLRALENKHFRENFLKEINLYIERFLELIIKSTSEFQQLTISTYFVQVVLHNLSTTSTDESNQEVNHSKLLDIQKYIHNHYSTDVSLTSLSDAFGYSTSYLSRVFKQEIGIGFSEYLKQVRLKASLKQILNSNLNITDIALANGFGSSSSFNRIFKESYNLTPTEYRQSYQENHNPIGGAEHLEKETILKNITREKQYVSHSVDASKQACKGYSPYNKVFNVGTLEFFGSSLNKKLLLEAKGLLKVGLVRFNIDIHNLINSKNEAMVLSDTIEYLAMSKMSPFLSFDFSNLNLNDQLDADLFAQSVIHYLIKEINKYNLDQLTQWFVEFKIGKESDSNTLNMIVINTIADFVKLAIGSDNVAIHLGLYTKDILDVSYDFLENSSVGYISFDLFLDQLSDNVSNISTITQEILEIKQNLLDKTNHNFDIIFTNFDIHKNPIQSYNDMQVRGSYLLDFISSITQEFEIVALANTIDKRHPVENKIIYGGNGIFTYNGLSKGVVHALISMRKLGTNILHHSPSVILAKKSFSDYVLLISNFSSFSLTEANTDYYLNPANTFNFENLNKKFSIQITNVNDGTYKIKQYYSRIDGSQLYGTLKKFNGVSNLLSDELESIQSTTRPELSLSTLESKDSILTIDFELKPNEYTMFYIYYQYE